MISKLQKNKLSSVRRERAGRHLSIRAQIKSKSGPEMMEEGSQAKNEFGRSELGISLLTPFISISFIHSNSLFICHHLSSNHHGLLSNSAETLSPFSKFQTPAKCTSDYIALNTSVPSCCS